MTTTATKYEGSSDPSTNSPTRILAPVDGKRFEPADDRGIVRSSAWFAVIRARWNFNSRLESPATITALSWRALPNCDQIRPPAFSTSLLSEMPICTFDRLRRRTGVYS